MKSIEKKSFLTKRKVVIIVPIILVLVGGGIALAYTTENWPFSKPATYDRSSDSTVDTKEDGNVDASNDKTDETDTTDTTDKSTVTPTPEDKTTQTGNEVDQTSAPEIANITRAEQSGSSIRVSATFNSASNGKCVLRLEKSGYSSIVKEVSIVVGPSYYVCNGFQVPRSELPVGGEWSAIVTHELGGKSSISERKTFNVQ